MKSVAVYKTDGSQAGTIDLPDDIFGIEPSMTAIHQVVKAHLANRRQGNASTKSRGEVNLVKAKMYRQKGTGRARHGSANAPIFVGGGAAFGPKPRSYSQKLNQKVKRMGLKSAYSIKATEEKIRVLEDFSFDVPKTKQMADILKAIGVNGEKTMLLVKDHSDTLYKSSRNIPTLQVQVANNANTYDVMNSDILIMTVGAVDRVKEVLAK